MLPGAVWFQKVQNGTLIMSEAKSLIENSINSLSVAVALLRQLEAQSGGLGMAAATAFGGLDAVLASLQEMCAKCTDPVSVTGNTVDQETCQKVMFGGPDEQGKIEDMMRSASEMIALLSRCAETVQTELSESDDGSDVKNAEGIAIGVRSTAVGLFITQCATVGQLTVGVIGCVGLARLIGIGKALESDQS